MLYIYCNHQLQYIFLRKTQAEHFRLSMSKKHLLPAHRISASGEQALAGRTMGEAPGETQKGEKTMISLYEIKRRIRKFFNKLAPACRETAQKRKEENYYKVKIDSRGRMQISLYGSVQVRNCLSDIMDVLGRELDYDDEEEDDTDRFLNAELFNQAQLERLAYIRNLREDLEKKINGEKDDPDVPVVNVECNMEDSDEEFEEYFARTVREAQVRAMKNKDEDEEGGEEVPDPEAS